ncbi:SMI1/KNR4 family protein [Vagococcus fessus]|uniref:Knr4/Smi1-like domain-containing protein n=1 Tax=Vagococcus fessus TaxID=120370 RepID=A0A430A8M8_9ENTE|nr:SMI1/KNR4 family protein [Vagococcus fessus]RSU03421.1 hypothetical protein CBF31_06830 [Vagococcus fessus]
MTNIVEELSNIEDIFYVGGCSDSQLKEAQELLGCTFPDDYIRYVEEFGCISFDAVEWTGLNIEGRLNVVTATETERELDPNFPEKYFVLENLGIDGKMILLNEEGYVYLFQQGTTKLVADSLLDYLSLIIE